MDHRLTRPIHLQSWVVFSLIEQMQLVSVKQQRKIFCTFVKINRNEKGNSHNLVIQLNLFSFLYILFQNSINIGTPVHLQGSFKKTFNSLHLFFKIFFFIFKFRFAGSFHTLSHASFYISQPAIISFLEIFKICFTFISRSFLFLFVFVFK